MRLHAALSLALVAVISAKAEGPPLQGTMPEDFLPALRPLLQTAVERSPSAISASIAVEQQEGQKYASYSILYPSVNVNGSYAVDTSKESNSQDSTSKGFYYGAGISQPVFQWGAYRNNALIGSLGLKIAQRQYAEAYRQLCILIREQYMFLVSKKIVLRNENFKVKLSNQDLDAQQARFESGAASQADVQSYQLALESEKLTRDKAADDYDYSKHQFMRLVGLDSLDDASIPLEIPHPEFSESLADAVVSGFVGNGIESTFQSQVYDMQVKQEDLQYSIAKVRLLPKVSANANYSYSNYTNAGSGTVSQYGLASETYGLTATWNIFDGFATRGAKISALAAKHSVERQMKTYVDASIDSIAEMRHQLGFAARAQSLAEVHYALIAAQVKRLDEDKNLGYGSQGTLDAGTLVLYSSGSYQADARSDYLQHWTEFVSLAGLDPAIENISPNYDR
jgi:outer membrane protein TolC